MGYWHVPETIQLRMMQTYPMALKIGLSERHEMHSNDGEPIVEFLFPKNVDHVHSYDAHFERVLQFLNARKDSELTNVWLFVTGLTPLLTSTIKAMKFYNYNLVGNARLNRAIDTLTLWHYDSLSGKYREQGATDLIEIPLI